MRVNHTLRFVRHRCRHAAGLALALLLGPRGGAATLQPDSIHTVLICRINGRMGNTLFLLPLIQRLHQLLPHAAIDLALAYPKAEELLAGVPGVRQIITVPNKAALQIWRYAPALRRLRACHYDLAIDPVRESTSGRAALSLCRATYRLGYATNSQWAPLTHAVPVSPDVLHHALEPVFLLSRAFGLPWEPQSVRLRLPLRDDELTAGRGVIAHAIGRDYSQISTRACGFFAHAAGLKFLGRDWWLAFWETFLALEPQAIPVECLPSPRHEPVDTRFARFHVPSTRGVSAAIAATRMFISTDTGPMHLASATDVPTVALFRASAPVLYRPLKSTDLVIDVSECSPATVARRCQQVWRRDRSVSR